MQTLSRNALAGGLLIIAATAPHAQQYSVTDLGTLGGTESRASGINRLGQVVGYSYISGDAAYHAYVFANGQMQDLGTLGGVNSYAYGINSAGQVVGNSEFSGGSSGVLHGFLHQNGSMQDLSSTSATWYAATGINEAGQIAGNAIASASSSSYEHAFLYSNGASQDLGTLGGYSSYAYGLNALGQVVGHSFLANNHTDDPFVYCNGSMKDLGNPGLFGWTASINDSGQMVGTTYLTSGYPHAFLYINDTPLDLGTLGGYDSFGYGINNNGQVVGWASTTSTDKHAFVYDDGFLVDLNTLVTASPLATFVTLGTANAINDNGQIAVEGVDSRTGYTHAYLLTPFAAPPPAPSNLAATPGNRQATLSWAATYGATSYNVYKGTTAGGESSTPVATGITATTTILRGLRNRTTYYFKIAAANGVGISAFSNEASAKPSRR